MTITNPLHISMYIDVLFPCLTLAKTRLRPYYMEKVTAQQTEAFCRCICRKDTHRKDTQKI